MSAFSTGPQAGKPSTTAIVLIVVGLFVVGLLGGGGVGWYRHRQAAATAADHPTSSVPPSAGGASPAAPGPAAPTASTSSPTSAPTPSTAATPSATPQPTPTRVATTSPAEVQQQALATLKELAAEDRPTVDIDGEWVAQLSSKYAGVYDKWQRTDSGSHTFRATDILAEHRALKTRFDEGEVRVVLVRGQDWGLGTTHKGDGATFWYTFVVGEFESKAEVEDFCGYAYPQYSGDQLDDYCFPRKLLARR